MYLSSVIEQQCHSVRVPQVSVHAQQGGTVQDVTTKIYFSPAHYE